MKFRHACIFGSALLLGAAIPALANPRVHRGPAAPRLFKERLAPKPKPAATSSTSSERPTQTQATQLDEPTAETAQPTPTPASDSK